VTPVNAKKREAEFCPIGLTRHWLCSFLTTNPKDRRVYHLRPAIARGRKKSCETEKLPLD
jgi:hypothetical protein